MEGTPPDFSGSSATLSDSDGFFGFDIQSTLFTNDLAFTAMTLTGTVLPEPGFGQLTYNPHHQSSLVIRYLTSQAGDPGPFVSLVPVIQTLPQFAVIQSGIQMAMQPNGDLILNFVGGTLQSASDIHGNWIDVPGNPAGTYAIPKADQTAQQFFRVKLGQ